MLQISQNVTQYNAGDPLGEITQGTLKILLLGSEDNGNQPLFDWQGKFAQGVGVLSDPKTGSLMFKGQNYAILNPKTPVANTAPTFDNPEFVKKTSWILDAIDSCDAIFINFLSKSVSPFPLMQLAFTTQSQKLVVRSSENYQNYGIVRLLCERYSIPLLPGGRNGNVFTVLQAMYSFLPAFRNINGLQLPS